MILDNVIAFCSYLHYRIRGVLVILSGVAEQFFFSPLSLEPLGGEWAIDFEEGVHQKLWQSITACSMDIRAVRMPCQVVTRRSFLEQNCPDGCRAC